MSEKGPPMTIQRPAAHAPDYVAYCSLVLVDKYGEQTKAPSKELLLASTEAYVEYSRDGRVVKASIARKRCEDAP
ncbi:hypothetical protein SDRG_01894 [Saprolegnia diclina VS20]|uniref:Uncharacterized protein n=1 Tax=Saprolegnia diclina (strain VS20) TaxID=1156394 RepID=T0SD40_SAPDV|nr:hypothetical protein SDRG_01894 [Saprolegnia diclina VS20]EQC40827.1 hypothetical protein SDRG_01894 [Saprolegnia diclina VS20]|eukprot:XP_008605671.1 hypothetical protein SDRG_01894 [Saprolegnia diclina VS20]